MRKNTKNTAPAAVAPAIVENPAAEAAETGAIMQVVGDEQAPQEQAAAPETEAAAAPAAEQPAALVDQVTARRIAETLPIAELLQRTRDIEALSKKVTFFQVTAGQLAEFRLGTPGMSDKLTIRTGQGQEWNTTKTETIQKVMDLLRADLADLTTAAETDLRQMLAA